MAAPFKDNIPPAKNNKSTLETRMAPEKQTILKVQEDMMLRALAQKAISERTRDAPMETNEETEDTLRRQKIRKDMILRALAQKAISERTRETNEETEDTLKRQKIMLRAIAQKAISERTRDAPRETNEETEDTRKRQKIRKDMMLRALAQKAISERTRDAPRETNEETEDTLKRQKIRDERRRERERERREREHRERERERRSEAEDVAMGKKSYITRDRDRDHNSEKIALILANSEYNARLFNQEKIMKAYRFKPDKSFTGTSEETGPRDRPVEFEKDSEEYSFGLNQFLDDEVKKGKKVMDKIGGSGTLNASAGSSMQDDNEGGSGRNRIKYEREKNEKK